MGNALFISKKQNTLGPSRTLIIGEPGSGKTRLAATWPEPLFLDSEFGAGSTGANRMLVRPGPEALPILDGTLKKLSNARYEDGALWIQIEDEDIPVRTLVIDSIDAFQQGEKQRIMKENRRTTMQMQDWGTLLDRMTPIMHTWSGLPIHVVVIAHVKESSPDDSSMGQVGLAVQGGFKDAMPRWFDYILHLRGRDRENRMVFTQPVVVSNVKYLAKDRHGTFNTLLEDEKAYFQIEEVDNLPERKVADLIRKRHVLGGEEGDEGRGFAGERTKAELLRIAREEVDMDANKLAEVLKENGIGSFDVEKWDEMLEIVRRSNGTAVPA